jgi:DNA (cytosine-5)-methyltransferase 1
VTVTIGSLFTGLGMLDHAVERVVDSELSWYCETDDVGVKVMRWRHRYATNYGDVTKVDWREVPPVDVLTGGTPCQDLSEAGRRLGMGPGTRSGLWSSMCDAIEVIRPKLVVWENVKGALSAPAVCEVESCPRCMGSRRRAPGMRALGRVLGDLADLGYDSWWYGIRASEVGAPHERLRIFLIGADASDTGWLAAQVPAEREDAAVEVAHGYGTARRTGVRLLPTPTTQDGENVGGKAQAARKTPPLNSTVLDDSGWGVYAPVIERWERLTRPAPKRTIPHAKGGRRLSPRFVEWVMGHPEGWSTDVPAVPRNALITALGNSVVPQQAEAAIRTFIADAAGGDAPGALPQVGWLLPTPNPFHARSAKQTPEEFRARRRALAGKGHKGHGATLDTVIESIEDGEPLHPGRLT